MMSCDVWCCRLIMRACSLFCLLLQVMKEVAAAYVQVRRRPRAARGPRNAMCRRKRKKYAPFLRGTDCRAVKLRARARAAEAGWLCGWFRGLLVWRHCHAHAFTTRASRRIRHT